MTRANPILSTSASASIMSLPHRPTSASTQTTPVQLASTASLTRSSKPEDFTKPFCDFLSKNPTVFHAANALGEDLKAAGYKKLTERGAWKLEKGGKYYFERNGSSVIAFAIGEEYEPGNGAAMIAAHIDALTARLKPISSLPAKAGFAQLGVAPYAGGLNGTWWDRDLGIAGRVLVKEDSGKIVEMLVDLEDPIARIPTLAPHFGAAAVGPFNQETQMVPIIGLDETHVYTSEETEMNKPSILGGEGSFASKQPPRLVKAIAAKLGLKDYSKIINWDLELYDTQHASVGGIDKEFIFGGRIDDKLCSWAAVQALISSSSSMSPGIIKVVGCFDDEEIGSLLRQGARGNLLPSTIERIVDCFSDKPVGANLMAQTYASSYLVSADVTHAVNPNFLNAYLAQHAPRLNVGMAISWDSNGHMTTDGVSAALMQRVADKCKATLQLFQIRNDSRSGGTVGPMLSSAMGCRAAEAGIPQLSMHSIRATTGSLDPGLGSAFYRGFFDYYEEVDKEFQ